MTQERIPPTPAQQRLVNIGMLIQFHLAAIGHLAMWLYMYHALLHPTIPEGWTYEEWYREGGFITEIFVYQGIPLSFGILIAVYILFRCLLAYANFGTALAIMISFNVLHTLLMCWTIIVPARLAIPIVLYSFACYYYYNTCNEHRTNQLQECRQARENEESADVS